MIRATDFVLGKSYRAVTPNSRKFKVIAIDDTGYTWQNNMFMTGRVSLESAERSLMLYEEVPDHAPELSVETDEWLDEYLKIRPSDSYDVQLLQNIQEDFEGISDRQDYHAMKGSGDEGTVSYFRGKEDAFLEAAKYIQRVIEKLKG